VDSREQLRQLLANNPDLSIDEHHSDIRLETAVASQSDEERGPESDLEERLLNYIRAVGLPIPRFGYRFDLTRRWRFDMAYVEEKIAVEVDGGIYGVGQPCPACGRRANGGHNSRDGYTSDREKINTAQIGGWIVLGVTPEQINSGEAAEFIRKALNRRIDEKEVRS